MSDRDARNLFRAILDDPDDDVPRLAFADWCEENGQAERAEFIRVQIALEVTPDDTALQARQEELHAAHGAEWAGILAAKTPVFRRGFVDTVDLWLDSFLALGPLLAEREDAPLETPVGGVRLLISGDEDVGRLLRSPWRDSVSRLDLEYLSTTNASHLSWLFDWADSESSRLAELACSFHCGGGEVFLSSLCAAFRPNSFPLLRELDLCGYDHRSSRIGYGGFCAYDPVDPEREPEARLLLTGWVLDDDSFDRLAKSPLLSRFEMLEAARCNVRDVGVEALAASPHAARLENVNLSDNDVTIGGLLSLSRGLPALRWLCLGGNPCERGMPSEHDDAGTTYCEGFMELRRRRVRMKWRW